jgi:hypothetical protein
MAGKGGGNDQPRTIFLSEGKIAVSNSSNIRRGAGIVGHWPCVSLGGGFCRTRFSSRCAGVSGVCAWVSRPCILSRRQKFLPNLRACRATSRTNRHKQEEPNPEAAIRSHRALLRKATLERRNAALHSPAILAGFRVRTFNKPASKRGETVPKTSAGSQTDSPDHGCIPKQASLKWVDCRPVEFQLADNNLKNEPRRANCMYCDSPASSNACGEL